MSMYFDDLSLEDRRLFFRNYDKFCGLFGTEVVDPLLMGISASKIVEIYEAPLDGPNVGAHRNYSGNCWQKPNRDLGRGHGHVKFHNGEWEMTKQVPVHKWLVPNQYQHLEHKKIIAPAMHAIFPWLADFKLNIYNMDFRDNHDDEFYVQLSLAHKGHSSLYVPYKAVLTGDVDAIIKRNSEYLKWYTKSDDVWNSIKDDPVVVAFLAKVKGD